MWLFKITYQRRNINKITNDTYRMVINMSVSFHYRDKDMIKILIMTVRPKLEYAVAWSQHLKHRKIRKNTEGGNETGSKLEGHVL